MLICNVVKLWGVLENLFATALWGKKVSKRKEIRCVPA